MQRIELLRSTLTDWRSSTVTLLDGEVCLLGEETYDSLIIGDGRTPANELIRIPLNTSGGSVFLGPAIPSTVPDIPRSSVFYLADTPGKYLGFGGIVLRKGETGFLIWKNDAWTKITLLQVDQELLEDSPNPVSGSVISRELKTKISGVKINGQVLEKDESGVISLTIDESLSESSENPIMNKTVTKILTWYEGE